MPNHIHLLVETIPGWPLEDLVKCWKSVSARGINRLLGKKGRVWQEEYWDRFIRDQRQYTNAVRYIAENPVKAKLVYHAEDWAWSSAARGILGGADKS